MTGSGRTRLTLGALLLWAFVFPRGVAFADLVVYSAFASEWKVLPGLMEASSPDPTAWRLLAFDDSAWMPGLAPVGYGHNPPYGTDLSTTDPPMQGNHTSVFLRRTFEVRDSSRVAEFRASVIYDDGLLIWINGQELQRLALAGELGEFVPFDVTAAEPHTASRVEEIVFEDPASFLIDGTNVIAVQVFNRALDNVDLKFDIELFDPSGPDLQPPMVVEVFPLPETTITKPKVEVLFGESVDGLEAGDLLMGAVAATEVEGSGPGPYLFSFPSPPVGQVTVEWKAEHGITDVSPDRNPFAGESWTYNFDPGATPPDLVITEILAANRRGLEDGEGDFEPWVEILNRGVEPVSLLRLSLSDDPRVPGKWIFPNVVLPPGEYLVVFVSGKDLTDPELPLHTNFMLAVQGDYLGLFSADSLRQPLFQLAREFPPQQPDVAYGFDASGTLSYLTPPTPGMPNNEATALEAVVSAPVLSVEHGFFDSPFELELLGSTPGAEIRYTTDGSEPELEDTLYSAPVTIRQTTPLRARAFKEGWVPSPIATRSYLFLDDVLLQEDMDPDVVNDPATSPVMRDAMLSVPTLSIVIEPSEMFGATGAYNVKGDHPTSVELIHPDGEGGFQVDCSVERHSNAVPKASLRLEFKREYGPEKLRYPLFESAPLHADSAVKFFDRVVLRGGKNQSWPSGEVRHLVTYVEDQWVRDSQIAMSGIGSHGTFVHLYINGVYWGLYNPVERPDHRFTSAYFGGGEEDYFATNHNVTGGHGGHIRGDPSRYDRLMELARARDLADTQKYEQFQAFVDVDKFIDYVILFWYAGFGDGVNNNWYAGMRLQPPGRFMFFMWDGELIFLNAAGPPGKDSAWVPPYFFDGFDSTPIVGIWKALVDNEEFRVRFADRVYKHCFNAGALSDESARLRLKTLAASIENAIIGESARWGRGRTRDGHWRDAVATLDAKMEGNAETLVAALRSWSHAGWPGIDLYPDIDPPVFSQHGGNVESGFTLRLFSPGGDVLYTLDGTDPRSPGGQVSARALAYPTAPIDAPVDAGGSVRVYVPADGSLGRGWTEPDFDDSGWLEGQTGVGFDRSDFPPDLNEEIHMNIGESLFEKHTSVYLRLAFTLEDPNVDFLWLDMKYDDGFAAYLNGELVASAGAPEDLQWDSRATRGNPGNAALEFQEFNITRARHLLLPGRNLLAIHGLNRSAADRDLLMLPRLRSGAFAAEGIRVEATTRVRTRALTGGLWSALDEATFNVTAGSPNALEITEISYNPPREGAEFLEIHNPAAEAVTLEGVEFTDGIQFRFSQGETLAAGGYLVLARDADVFALSYPDVPLAGTYLGQLANEGEKLTLRDPQGVTIVSVDYNDGDFWPLGPDGFGYTLVPPDTARDLTDLYRDPRAWRASNAPLGSPGAADPEPAPGGVFVSEVVTRTSDGSGAVELWNFTATDLDLGGWFLSPDRTDAASLKAYELPAATVIGGGDFLVVTDADLGFALDPFGGGVYLASADRTGELTGYIVGVDFGSTEPGVAFGLHETSEGLLEFTALRSPTLGAPNALPRSPEVAINEIHYHPPDGESEFIELLNLTSAAVDLEGWRVRGIFDRLREGSFVFPPGVVVPTAGFLVLVPGDPDRFRSTYGVPEQAAVVGPYGGALSNAGETLRLEKPVPGTREAFVRVDKVRYDDRAPWPRQPDGDGNSLERIRAEDFGGEVLNWDASVPSGGTPGTTNSVAKPVEPPPSGRQRPGDITQDATLNIVDAVVLLAHLFGNSARLPCEGDTIAEGGNRLLTDADGSGKVDLTDAVFLLDYLFRGGSTPALGSSCVPTVGCPDACGATE
jgi:hypothetical protein